MAVSDALLTWCSPQALRVIAEVGRLADRRKVAVYVVGGFVRDALLHRRNDDLDFVVEGDAIALAKIYSDQMKSRMISRRQFGTATVFLADGLVVDFVGARAEAYAFPGALPVVRPGTLREDLFRRDFSINTLAVCVNKACFGEIKDYFGGRADIVGKRVRVLHGISFKDDPTRIFRAVRFEQRFGFCIDTETLKLAKAALRSDDVRRVHPSRYVHELWKILDEKEPLAYVRRLSQLKVFGVFGVEWRIDFRLLERVQKTVAEFKKRAAFPTDYDGRLIWLVALLSQMSDKDVERFVSGAQLTKRQKDSILQGHRSEEFLKYFKKANLAPSSVHEELSRLEKEAVVFLYARVTEPLIRRRIWNFLCCAGTTVTLTGSDLKKMGAEGPQIGAVLSELFKLKIDGKVKTRAQELACAKKILGR